jgi:type II secretory pathway pseudopilin PulG
MSTMKKTGFTLLELIMVLGMTVVLMGTVMYVFLVTTRTWNAGQDRAGVRTEVTQAIEAMTQDLFEATSINLVNANNLEFEAGASSYRFCLYSSDDPGFTYTGTSYDLLKGSGTVDCGQGAVMARGVQPTVFSYADGMVILDLTAARNGSTIHMRTKVRPRNLP